MRRRSILNKLRDLTSPEINTPLPQESRELALPPVSTPVGERPPMDISVPAMADPGSAPGIMQSIIQSPTSRRTVLEAARAAPMAGRIARNLQTPQIMSRATLTPEQIVSLATRGGDVEDIFARNEEIVKKYLDAKLKGISPMRMAGMDQPWEPGNEERLRSFQGLRDHAATARDLGLGPDIKAIGDMYFRSAQPTVENFSRGPVDENFWGRVGPTARLVERPGGGLSEAYEFEINDEAIKAVESLIDNIPTDPRAARNFIRGDIDDSGFQMTDEQRHRLLLEALKEDDINVRSMRELFDRAAGAGQAEIRSIEQILEDLSNIPSGDWYPDPGEYDRNLLEEIGGPWYDFMKYGE